MRAAGAVVATALLTFVPSPATTAGTTPGDNVTVSWLSTGDSYSSGEGVRGNEGDCAQSHQAWGPQAARLLHSEHGWDIGATVFAACTGHLVEDFYNARTSDKASLWDWALEQPGAPTSERFDVITMSFGGNDIGFAEVIMDCLAAPIVRYASLEGLVELGGRGRLIPAHVARDALSTASADWLPFAGESCSTGEQPCAAAGSPAATPTCSDGSPSNSIVGWPRPWPTSTTRSVASASCTRR